MFVPHVSGTRTPSWSPTAAVRGPSQPGWRLSTSHQDSLPACEAGSHVPLDNAQLTLTTYQEGPQHQSVASQHEWDESASGLVTVTNVPTTAHHRVQSI